MVKKLKNIFYPYISKVENEIRIGSIENPWYVGWHSWTFTISYETTGYEDGFGELHICILGWHSVFKMPWKSKELPNGDCDPPRYGIWIHDNAIFFHYGGHGNGNNKKLYFKSWDIPFFSSKFIRHTIEINDNGKIFMDDYKKYECIIDPSTGNKVYVGSENPLINKHRTYFRDKYDNKLIGCTYYIEEWEWQPKWLTWTSKFKTVRKNIDISFDEEVGPKKGSYKGGVLGCSYTMLPGESAEQCIGRMEIERDFAKR